MNLHWHELFTQSVLSWKDEWTLKSPPHLTTLKQLKHFLDLIHIKYCLVKPYCEVAGYPLVDPRELIPSFESDPFEHAKLPGFSLVAFARPIQYFAEVFQFDLLAPVNATTRPDHGQLRMARNHHTIQSRLPRHLHEPFRQRFLRENVTSLANYPALTPYLTTLDRGQVLGMDGPHPQDLSFYLAGMYASFPSDLDTEVKRHGLRIGKFTLDDADSYDKNRQLVLQHLMELYGFPIASERRTSAALFARRLHKMGEKFLIRTLGQSDRTLTTIWNAGDPSPYPAVEKTALVSLDENAHDAILQLEEGGYFIDRKQRVVILRVLYRQHKFSLDNVRQERAISVAAQEIIHPLTGKALSTLNIIRETTNMFLRLNDIVRGEYTGRIVYKRSEVVENTDTEEKRLKFLFAWLSKHQRRIIGYSDEFFANIDKVLGGYLFDPGNDELFADTKEIYQEVLAKYSFIQQARKVRTLEDLQHRTLKGVRISYQRMLEEAAALLHDLKFEIVSYFDTLVSTVIAIGESILNDRYLLRTYIEKPDDALTASGLDIKKNFGKLVTLLDEFKAIQKTRNEGGMGTQSPQYYF